VLALLRASPECSAVTVVVIAPVLIPKPGYANWHAAFTMKGRQNVPARWRTNLIWRSKPKEATMPTRFDTGIFEPELAKLMKSAFQAALAKVSVAPEDEIVAKHHLAGAIVELVGAGARDRDHIVAKALASLASGEGLSGEWMIKRPEPNSG
jgi:hypothetical protein